MEIIVLFVGAFFIIIGIYLAGEQTASIKRRQDDMALRFKSLPNFSPTQHVIGCDGFSGIAVDESRNKICLMLFGENNESERVMSYKDIISVELFEDGVSITKTQRTSQIGGALVGGTLLGGVGALVGGLSGKTQTSGIIRRVDLRIVVNDINAPLHDVKFLNFESKKDSALYIQAIQFARIWLGIVEVLIRRADADDKSSVDKESIAQVSKH